VFTILIWSITVPAERRQKKKTTTTIIKYMLCKLLFIFFSTSSHLENSFFLKRFVFCKMCSIAFLKPRSLSEFTFSQYRPFCFCKMCSIPQKCLRSYFSTMPTLFVFLNVFYRLSATSIFQKLLSVFWTIWDRMIALLLAG